MWLASDGCPVSASVRRNLKVFSIEVQNIMRGSMEEEEEEEEEEKKKKKKKKKEEEEEEEEKNYTTLVTISYEYCG
jgi:hypothetical protein